MECGTTLTIDRTTLSGNTAATSGGGLFVDGALQMVNSTVSGNRHRLRRPARSAAAWRLARAAVATLTNVTVADNTATISGGGISNAGVLHVLNTLVANNSAPAASDVDGVVTSLGHNLVRDPGGSSGWDSTDLLNIDPMLGPLQNNTGTTLTHALLYGSPAIDAGTNTDAPSTDQLGIVRPQDANADGTATVDIGAVERYYGEIHGVLFRDDNGNGIREIREPRLPGRDCLRGPQRQRVARMNQSSSHSHR